MGITSERPRARVCYPHRAVPQPDPGDSGRSAAPLPPVTATCAQRELDVWTRIEAEAMPVARSRAARQSEPGELRRHRHGGNLAAAASPRPRPHACPRPATITHGRRPPARRSPQRVPSALRSPRVAAPSHTRPHLLSARPPRGSTSIPGERGPAAATAPPPSRGGGAPAPPPGFSHGRHGTTTPSMPRGPPPLCASRRAPRGAMTTAPGGRCAQSGRVERRVGHVLFELCLRGICAPLSSVRGHGARLRPVGDEP